MPSWRWIQPGCGLEALEQFGAGVVVFRRLDGTVEEALREAVHLGLRVLAIQEGDELLAPADVWRLLEAGASDVMHAAEPGLRERAEARLGRWSEVEQLAREVAGKLVGGSAVWRRLLQEMVEVTRFTDLPVLILGETGTGKELLATAIHEMDQRPGKRALVTVDCTNLAPELSGSELFGHEKGAFTGAVSSRDGAVSLSHKGTLFLDEVGELPLPLQAQLLRVLQEKTYRKVGGNAWQQSDFRLICATNRDLAAEVSAGRFRADLYFRIASSVFRSPPLRERREDILPLARHFLGQIPVDDEITGMDSAVEQFLQARDYPGNVRELRQLVLRMGQRHTGPGPITPGDLPSDEWPKGIGRWRAWPEADTGFDEAIGRALDAGIGLQEISNAAKDAAIRLTVHREQGNLQRAAKRLGVTDRALQIRKAGGTK
jgi:transcriptional regulator with GAF, ATPase, and Fis domain